MVPYELVHTVCRSPSGIMAASYQIGQAKTKIPPVFPSGIRHSRINFMAQTLERREKLNEIYLAL